MPETLAGRIASRIRASPATSSRPIVSTPHHREVLTGPRKCRIAELGFHPTEIATGAGGDVEDMKFVFPAKRAGAAVACETDEPAGRERPAEGLIAAVQSARDSESQFKNR